MFVSSKAQETVFDVTYYFKRDFTYISMYLPVNSHFLIISSKAQIKGVLITSKGRKDVDRLGNRNVSNVTKRRVE